MESCGFESSSAMEEADEQSASQESGSEINNDKPNERHLSEATMSVASVSNLDTGTLSESIPSQSSIALKNEDGKEIEGSSSAQADVIESSPVQNDFVPHKTDLVDFSDVTVKQEPEDLNKDCYVVQVKPGIGDQKSLSTVRSLVSYRTDESNCEDSSDHSEDSSDDSADIEER